MSGVSVKQQQAIALLCAGCARVEVARRVGVSRGTLWNWMYRNQRFEEALSAWRREMAGSARARLLGLTGAGYRAIALALERGDAKVALAVFKGLGVLDQGREGEAEEEQHVVIRRRLVDRSGKRGEQGVNFET